MTSRRLTAFCIAWFFQSMVQGEEHRLRLVVVDAANGAPVAARVRLTDQAGQPHFFTSVGDDGSAVVYQKRNSINTASTVAHTTVGAHPVDASLPPGRYELTVSHGQAYIPVQRTVDVVADDEITIGLSRWCDPNARGWYSGDTHLHRTVDELRNVVLAEDLNVALPLSYWVIRSDVLPLDSDRSDPDVGRELVRVDDQHVIWPRNSEYEIFDIGDQQHILGALFVLGHTEPLPVSVPPWGPVIRAAKRADASVLFDMDKLDWYDAMVLPPLAPRSLYELANNHMWETEFAYRDWYTFAPSYIQAPDGSTGGGHRDWIDYTMGMYYTLLNCGFRMPPSAGTANGVHPVAAGFSRVYVQLDDGFEGDDASFDRWRQGLQQGRSFVTTGPMLYAKADGHPAGHVFHITSDTESRQVELEIEVESIEELSYGELLFNGRPIELLRAQNMTRQAGGYRSTIKTQFQLDRPGWFAVRFWEPRDDGQSRFVHSAPWYVEGTGVRVAPTDAQKQYLISRMKHSIRRSQNVVDEAAFSEYEDALAFYQALPVADDQSEVHAQSRPLTPSNREEWLFNMIVDHHYTRDEVRMATGLSMADAQAEVDRHQKFANTRQSTQTVKMRRYPGGRHPRRGFLEGAVNPQRETKVSLFAPWSDGGYVVVDLPEAVFTDLGLIYLAHEHIPTIWEEQGIKLAAMEWRGDDDDQLTMIRRLPNGIVIESAIRRVDDGAEMVLSLDNGTTKPMTEMRAQICTMLKAAVGFHVQERLEHIVDGPLVAIRGDPRQHPDRWIITGWVPQQRVWTNPPVPCVHSDPTFADCMPGESTTARGGLWFYEGTDIRAELSKRLAWLEQ